MALLTPENYAKGFLIDDELMGAVTENPDQAGHYIAFVLRHTTGEYLGYQPFPTLEAALLQLNQVKRDWVYERAGGCGGCEDGSGNCGNGNCKVGEYNQAKKCGTSACAPTEGA